MADDDFNPFEVLGLDPAKDADISDDDVRKVFRKLSLTYHPDKNKASDAAAVFQRITAAKDMLLDPTARALLRDYHRNKRQRAEAQAYAQAQMDEETCEQFKKRKFFRDELDRREAQERAGINEEQRARARLDQQLNELRRKAMERAKATAQIHRSVALSKAPAPSDTGPGRSKRPLDVGPDTLAQLQRTLKVSWAARASAGLDDTAVKAQVAAPFSDFPGGVEVVLLKSKSKPSKKAVASVVMATARGAAAAARSAVFLKSVSGQDEPALVLPLPKVADLSAVTSEHTAAVNAAAARMRDAHPAPPPTSNTRAAVGSFPQGAFEAQQSAATKRAKAASGAAERPSSFPMQSSAKSATDRIGDAAAPSTGHAATQLRTSFPGATEALVGTGTAGQSATDMGAASEHAASAYATGDHPGVTQHKSETSHVSATFPAAMLAPSAHKGAERASLRAKLLAEAEAEDLAEDAQHSAV